MSIRPLCLNSFINKSISRGWEKMIKTDFPTPISAKVLMSEEALKPYKEYQTESGRLFGLLHGQEYVVKQITDYGKGNIDVLLEEDSAGQKNILYASKFFTNK